MLIQYGSAELNVIHIKDDIEYPKTHKNIIVNYGDVIFIPANVSINVNYCQSSEDVFKAWIGCVNQKIMPNSYTLTSSIVSIDRLPLKNFKKVVKPNM